MKSVMAWFRRQPDEGGRQYVHRTDAEHEMTLAMIRANIDAMLHTGWRGCDMLLFSNFEFGYRGVRAIPLERPTRIAYFSKWVAALQAMRLHPREDLFVHDPDCFVADRFRSAPLPPGKLVGFCQYRFGTQGGVSFFRPRARRIVREILSRGERLRFINDEHVIAQMREKHRAAWEDLNSTWNVGLCRWERRLAQAEKPVRVFHTKPNEPHEMNKHLPAWLIAIFKRHGIWYAQQPVEATA